MRVYLRDRSARTIFTCCHTEIEVEDQTFHLTQSQYTDTGPTSRSSDPITPGAWHLLSLQIFTVCLIVILKQSHFPTNCFTLAKTDCALAISYWSYIHSLSHTPLSSLSLPGHIALSQQPNSIGGLVERRPHRERWARVGWLLACLTSQQHASVPRGRICTDNCMCCHTEIEVADQTLHLTQ